MSPKHNKQLLSLAIDNHHLGNVIQVAIALASLLFASAAFALGPELLTNGSF
jgi:hypothetical protein